MPTDISKDDIRALKEGRDGAMAELVNSHTQTLLAVSFAMGFSQADAEELVQETFAAFLSALDRFEGRSQIKTYLVGILYNKAADFRRKSYREESLDKIQDDFEKRFNESGLWSRPPLGPEESVLTGEIKELIAQCAEGLTLSQKTAFFLRESEGESSEDICNILGVSYTNLRVLLYRARIKLQECLEKKWESGKHD